MQVNRLPGKRLESQIKQWQFQSVNWWCHYRAAQPREILSICRILLGKPHWAGDRKHNTMFWHNYYLQLHVFWWQLQSLLSESVCEIVCSSSCMSGYLKPLKNNNNSMKSSRQQLLKIARQNEVWYVLCVQRKCVAELYAFKQIHSIRGNEDFVTGHINFR